eukprot:2184851-Pleurochrysis_carterae.AAC.1
MKPMGDLAWDKKVWNPSFSGERVKLGCMCAMKKGREGGLRGERKARGEIDKMTRRQSDRQMDKHID